MIIILLPYLKDIILGLMSEILNALDVIKPLIQEEILIEYENK